MTPNQPKTIIIKEVEEYLNWCYENPNKINKKRWLLIKNIVEPTLRRADIFFDEEKYYKCIDYCEKWYYPLFPYQKFIYAFVFMFKNKNFSFENKIPLFHKFIIEMGRGNGKDGFIAPLCNFLQTPMYGIKNYNIDIVATSESQSKDTFLVVHDMMTSNIKKMKKLFYISLELIMNLFTKSRLRYNTSNAKTKDGKKVGAIVFNEYHAYENYEQISVFESAGGKVPHFRIFIITTQGNVREGPLDDELEYCASILNGEDNNLGVFPFLCELDDLKEVDNHEMWVKANPSIEYMPNLLEVIKQQYQEQKERPQKRFEFLTKRMNVPSRDETTCVASWENILATNQEIPDLKGMSCLGGIDYASMNDFCAVGLLFKQNGKRYWMHHSFICSNSIHLKMVNKKLKIDLAVEKGLATMVNTNSINPEVVVSWFVQQSKKYNILKIACDDYRFALLKEAFEKEGFYEKCKKYPNGRIIVVRSGPITHNRVATIIDDMFYNQTLVYGDDMLMRWYTNNTAVKVDGKGNKTYEKIEYQTRKNDGFMALVHVMSIDKELPTIKSSGKLMRPIIG
ncbi:MAG: terminase large subunit [Bacilli bacterium]|nr:terminase large subunit [Bacilli bacterium]MDD4794974.1 terminase large subunit [Bacilli bacterium]